MDPGVLVSARISSRGHGAPAQLLTAWLEGRFELVVSEKVLAELERVLLRPKFRRYTSDDEVRQYIDLLKQTATYETDPPSPHDQLTPDPGDDYLVILARSTLASVLISGDAHLTGIADPDPVVLTPRAFLDILNQTG